jgi:hypothetical protein
MHFYFILTSLKNDLKLINNQKNYFSEKWLIKILENEMNVS